MKANDHEQLGVGFDGSVDLREGLDGAFEGAIGDCVIEGGESATARLAEGIVGEGRIAEERRSTQGIDDEGVLINTGEIRGEVRACLRDELGSDGRQGGGLRGYCEKSSSIHAGDYSLRIDDHFPANQGPLPNELRRRDLRDRSRPMNR